MQATRRTPDAPIEVLHRALSRYDFIAPTGCHQSTYSTGSHGYAQVGWGVPGEARTATVLCHRAAWQAVHGPIPRGLTVDHTCKNRRCVNVEHLRLLTNLENARRTSGRDWPIGECVNGHPNSAMHTQRGGKRVWPICLDKSRQRYLDKRAG